MLCLTEWVSIQVIYERNGWVTVMCKGADANVFALVDASADSPSIRETVPADAPGLVRMDNRRMHVQTKSRVLFSCSFVLVFASCT